MTKRKQPTDQLGKTLSPKQARFVDEYLVDLNATQAAVRAGYSQRTAGILGSQLLNKPHVAAAIAERKTARSEKTGVTATRVVEEMAAVAFSDIGEILDFSGPVARLRRPEEISERARRAVASVKVKRQREGSGEDAVEVEIIEFRLWDKNAALAQLAKHTGAVKEKVDVKGDLSLQVVERVVDKKLTFEEFNQIPPDEQARRLNELAVDEFKKFGVADRVRLLREAIKSSPIPS